MNKSHSLFLAGVTLALLAGCAGLNNVTSDVSTYGDWPQGRTPGTFAFERLPSQQARAEETAVLEASAEPALRKAGFSPVAAGQQPDVLVQVGARTTQTVAPLWDDPLWWRGGFGYWRHGPWLSPRWGLYGRVDNPRYDREVALLIRNRSDGKPLFEARASTEGNFRFDRGLLSAMYDAALIDFPNTGVNPRSVVTTLPVQ